MYNVLASCYKHGTAGAGRREEKMHFVFGFVLGHALLMERLAAGDLLIVLLLFFSPPQFVVVVCVCV